ncbi:MAG: hypothetical protein FJ320_05795 [SAR202 cluster bacterium]|nr:hypothetical protein [SAR202 cluster bacterium]
MKLRDLLTLILYIDVSKIDKARRKKLRRITTGVVLIAISGVVLIVMVLKENASVGAMIFVGLMMLAFSVVGVRLGYKIIPDE